MIFIQHSRSEKEKIEVQVEKKLKLDITWARDDYINHFIYNKRYKVDIPIVTPKLDILKNIMIPI